MVTAIVFALLATAGIVWVQAVGGFGSSSGTEIRSEDLASDVGDTAPGPSRRGEPQGSTYYEMFKLRPDDVDTGVKNAKPLAMRVDAMTPERVRIAWSVYPYDKDRPAEPPTRVVVWWEIEGNPQSRKTVAVSGKDGDMFINTIEPGAVYRVSVAAWYYSGSKWLESRPSSMSFRTITDWLGPMDKELDPRRVNGWN
jgi:hypothetical protein